jgi:hypothetical protein
MGLFSRDSGAISCLVGALEDDMVLVGSIKIDVVRDGCFGVDLYTE